MGCTSCFFNAFFWFLEHFGVAFVVVSKSEEQKPEQICAQLMSRKHSLSSVSALCVGQLVLAARSSMECLAKHS